MKRSIWEGNQEKFQPIIQGFTNDGAHNLNLMRKSDSQCYATIPGNGNVFQLKVEYESQPEKVLHISFFNPEIMSFEKCYAMKADLSFSGIFLITAMSGFKDPNYHFVRSFKLFDPKTESVNNRFQDSHHEKALRENLAEKISEDINDLVHQKGSETTNLSEV